MTTITREQAIEGFRRLADLIEQNPEMPLPYYGSSQPIAIYCHGRVAFSAAVRAFGTGLKSESDVGTSFESIDFRPSNFPLPIKIAGFKSAMCEATYVTRVVPATVIPAQPARPATPEMVILEHEETVLQWDCHPILEPLEVA